MPPVSKARARIHVLFHANPPGKDITRFGFRGANEYLRFIRGALPAELRLTCGRGLLDAIEDERRGGRTDDGPRLRDLQGALDDPRTRMIVAANGGAYFSRLLPQIDFSPLAARRTPLWALGFSEMTSLVNIVAAFRCGRGVYWLCPNYLAWKIRPPADARRAFAAFWRGLPPRAADGELGARHVGGARPPTQRVRLIGGCLSVLAATLGGQLGRRMRPDGRWLVLEDVNEAPYRIDRYLATLKLAGWFERIAGVLLGDFHTSDVADQTDAVVALLRYHAPRRLPLLATGEFGHVWPMVGLPLNRPLRMSARRGGAVLQCIPCVL